MRKISSFIMACAMCLSMTVVGTVAPQVAVQAEETATVELKEAPKAPSTYKTVAGYDCQLNYGDDAEEWLSAIDKVEVNGIEYEKATSSYSIWNNAKYYAKATLDSSDSTDVRYLLIGEGKFEKDESAVNKVVISADGYKDLVLEVNKDGKTVAIHTKHTGGTATCTKKAVCDFCGEEYGEAHLITMEMNMSLTELITGRNVRMKVVMLRLKKKHIKVAKLQQQREQSVKYVEQNMEI